MIEPADPECLLSLAYVRADRREAMAALWAIDDLLGAVLRAGHEPMVSQLRFTWWHDALSRLDTAPPPAQPVLEAIYRAVLPLGVTGTQLSEMIEGWEVLLEDSAMSEASLGHYAARRGSILFAAAARLLGANDAGIDAAGEGWALVDLGLHLSDTAAAARALALATPRLKSALAIRWSSAARPLGMLAHLALIDAKAARNPARRQGSPARVARMIKHWLTGR